MMVGHRRTTVLLVLALLPLQGCFTVASTFLYGHNTRGDELDAREPSHVVALSVQRVSGGVELSVLYDDGLLRHAEWDLRSVPIWTEDTEHGLTSNLDAEHTFERLGKLEGLGRWTELVAELDRLLVEGGDRVIDTPAGPRLVRDEARRWLLALTGRGRDAYALAHDASAALLLEEACRQPGHTALEQILGLHPASAAAPEARRLLIGRLVEAGDLSAARPHVGLLRRAPGLDAAERARLNRIHERLPKAPPDAGPANALSWRPLAPEPGWPEPQGQRALVSTSGRSGLVLDSDQLQRFSAGGEPLARLDLRRTKPRVSPLPWRTRLARGARFVVHATLFTVGVAMDLCTWPLQLTGLLLYLGIAD